MVKQEFETFPKSVLEISLFNLYLLKKFQKGGSRILHGLEPNQKFKNKRLGNINVYNNTIEKFKSDRKYDLIIMTHVLEHLLDPLLALKKCSKLQKYNQKILIEVPLFEKFELYPIAGLTMEHLSYFNETNLKETIMKVGYEILSSTKTYHSTAMPFITIIARKVKTKNVSKRSKQYKAQSNNLREYIKAHKINYLKINNKLKKINKNIPTFLYAVGMTASSFVYHSNIQKKIKLKGIFDGNKDKIGGNFGNLNVLDYKEFAKKKFTKNIIITSEFSSDAISKKIKSKYNNVYTLDKKHGIKKI